jgi:hypothetical protein
LSNYKRSSGHTIKACFQQDQNRPCAIKDTW